jgi:hypothetical protein
MTYSTNVPNASQSPASFPTQNQTNFTRLKALVGADHQFNDTLAGNDGYHKVARWVTQGGSFGDGTPGAIAGVGQLYTKSASVNRSGASETSQHLFYKQGDNASAAKEIPISVTPIRAFVNFDSTGTIRSSFGVSSVSKTATGRYTITFSPALPSDGYAASVTGARSGSGQQIFGQVASGTYGSNVTTTTLKVEFYSDNGNYQDVVMGNVIVVGG